MANKYDFIIGDRYEQEIKHLSLRPAWRYYWKWYLLIVIALSLIITTELKIAGFSVSLIVLAIVVIHRFRYVFIVTSRRVISRKGLIARNTDEIEIRHTREYSVRQGIVGRILNYGDIEISSAASTGVEVAFIGIISPQDLKEAIRSVRNGW